VRPRVVVLALAALAPAAAAQEPGLAVPYTRFVLPNGLTVLVDACSGNDKERARPQFHRRTWPWLERLRAVGVRPEDVVLYGESLGSGVAVQVALEKPVAGLILDAPYTSIVELGAQVYPFLPVRLLLSDRYETVRYIGRIRAPVLVLHGERDRVVPIEMGRRVFAAAPGPKRIATFREAGHSDHHLYGSYDVVLAWLRELGARPPGSADR